jgi:hypothetical protein
MKKKFVFLRYEAWRRLILMNYVTTLMASLKLLLSLYMCFLNYLTGLLLMVC